MQTLGPIFFLAAPATAIVASASVAAPAPAHNASGAAEAGLVAAEQQRFAALVAGDLAAIARGMTDDAVFGHLTGKRESKAEFIDDIRSGKLPFRSVVAKDRVARVFGNVGVTRGVVDMVVGERHLSDSYLAVYVKRDGRWQLLDWQSAAPPPKPGERPWTPDQPPPGFGPQDGRPSQPQQR